MFEVREAAPDDGRGIVAVVISAVATLRRTYQPTAEAVDRDHDIVRARLVALDGGTIVGTAQYEHHDARVHVVGLGVLETHRRRGVARALIDALAELAPKLSLYTIRETGNVEVFERLGFRVVSETVADDFVSARHATLTEVYMER